MGALELAQQAKHRAFLASRSSKAFAQKARAGVADLANPILAERSSYQFDPARYRRSFLVRSPPVEGTLTELPRRVVCCWTGENELTPNRLSSLERLRSRVGVPVVLVTPDNLHEWILPDHPLHPAYESLSLVHRSDYLRAYLMHHHGGGYSDIKEATSSWVPAFENLERRPEKWALGYREIGVEAMTRAPGRLGRDLRRNYSRLIGCTAMIMRSHTPFTGEWLREVERRMDYYAPQLAEFPGGERGAVVGYPVSWTRLLGRVFHPLSLKYMDRLVIDDRVKLKFEDYR